MWRREDLYKALNELRLDNYRNLFIHANLGLSGVCGTSPSNPHGVFLDTMQDLVGKTSNFFLPAFTYSFGNGNTFRPYSDHGLKGMGLVSQAAWERQYYRTLDPMFSLFGFGETVHEFAPKNTVHSSHGEGSNFAKLVDDNVGLILVNVGCGTTLIHELEYRFKVNYRFLKEFVGLCQYNPNSPKKLIRWTAFVNKREIPHSQADFSSLNRDLFSESNIKKVKLGRGYIVHFDTEFLTSFLKIKLDETPWYLTKQGRLDLESAVR
jgi:aminoglycoside N3'-acetyltransferase